MRLGKGPSGASVRSARLESLEPRMLLSASPLSLELSGGPHSENAGEAAQILSLFDPAWFESLRKETKSFPAFSAQSSAFAAGEDSAGPDGFGVSASPTSSRQWIVQLSAEISAKVSSVAEVTRWLDLSGVNAEVVRGLGRAGLVLVEVRDASQSEEVIALLASHPAVAYYEPNGPVSIAVTPNDLQFSSQWALHNTGQLGGLIDADVDGPEAWDISRGSRGVVVAVVDTGIDLTHPDLVDNLWINSREIPGNSIDDDRNGLVDDVYGYDFAARDGDPRDEHGHGTHVAGIIGAVGNNQSGVAGINWEVSLMAVRFLDASGVGTTSDAVLAINYVTMMRSRFGVNVRAINASWGGGSYSQSLEQAIRASGAAGILFVAAAGNDSSNNDQSPQYPASYNLPNVLAVSATDRQDRLSSFSNFGTTSVHLAAPGQSILSTISGGGYGMMSGTSMATAFVSGAVALASAAAPEVAAAELREAILAGTDRLSGLIGRVATGGRLNLRNTLDQLGIRVVASGPASGSIVQEIPALYWVEFSGPVDPYSLGPADFRVNGIAASQVALVGATRAEFRFATSPILRQGPQLVSMESGSVRSAGDHRPLRAWESLFFWDAQPGRVISTEPAEGSVLSQAPDYLVLNFNEPLNASSVSEDDLRLSEGRITAVQTLPNSVRFGLADLPFDGQVEYELKAAGVLDQFGNPVQGYRGSFVIRDPSLVVFAAADTPQSIRDFQYTRSYINIPRPLTIADIDVEVSITHSFTADLDAFLIAPDGTRVELFTDVGGSGRDLSRTIFDSEASVPITSGSAPFRGRFRPEGSLAGLYQRNAQGTWTLEIYDDGWMDQGTLVGWRIVFREGPARPPSVVGVEPLPKPGQETAEPIRQIRVHFSAAMDNTVEILADGTRLDEVGPDRVWDTADDRRFGLQIVLDPSTPTEALLIPNAGRLPPGSYRLQLAAKAWRDLQGRPLDGNGDGIAEDDFVRTFSVLPGVLFASNSGPLPIRDYTSTLSTLEIGEAFDLLDVDVLVEIEHTFVADLDAYLIGPNGVRVELFSDVGGSGENFAGTILDDEAPTSITSGTAPFIGRYRPEGSLSVFRGIQAQGQWTLELYDDSALDQGELRNWGLIVQGIPLVAPRVISWEANPLVFDRLGAFIIRFDQPMAAETFDPQKDVISLRGPNGAVPITHAWWIDSRSLWLGLPTQYVPGEYTLELAPTIQSRWGFHLDTDRDGVPGEPVEDRLQIRWPIARTLGVVDWRREPISVSTGAEWLRFQTQFRGFCTAILESDGNTPWVLEVFHWPNEPPLQSVSVTGRLRVDWLSETSGETFFVRISTPGPASHPAQLTLVNLLEMKPGDGLVVHGTAGEDRISLARGPGRDTLSLKINGVSYQVGVSEARRVSVSGGLGEDQFRFVDEGPIDITVEQGRISLSATPLQILLQDVEQTVAHGVGGTARFNGFVGQVASLSVWPQGLRFSNGSILVELEGVDRVHAMAPRGGPSRLVLRGSAGNDSLTFQPDRTLWQSGSFQLEARGFTEIDAAAGSGGNDLANLTGGSGDDAALATPKYASLSGPGYFIRAMNFSKVTLSPGRGGNDLVRFFDSSGDDQFVGTPEYAVLQGPGYYLRALMFPQVVASATNGGADKAKLYDSPGNDVFSGSPSHFKWRGEGFDIRGNGFKTVVAYAESGGQDRASLTGSAGDDLLVCRPTGASLSGAGFSLLAQGFRQTSIYGVGGTDTASLYDSSGADTLVATATYTTLTGPEFQYRVFGFPRVYAYSFAGGADVAKLYESAQSDPSVSTKVVLTATYGTLLGQDFFSRAWAFPSILAFAAGGAKTIAKFYGSEASELLEANEQFVSLSGGNWRRQAFGYRWVEVYGGQGANRLQWLGSSAEERLTVRLDGFTAESDSLRLRAEGFRQVRAVGNPHRQDAAIVWDSPLDDLLRAEADWVRVSNRELEYLVELIGFGVVEAHSTNPGDQKVVAEGVDFLITAGWW